MPLFLGGPFGMFAIAIWNSNAAKDDNFEIKLNGTSIGTINNNSSTVTGRLFADPAFSPAFSPSIFRPVGFSTLIFPGQSFETTIDLDMSLLDQVGTNTVDIYNTQDNGNGNFGTVQIGYWTLNNSGNYEFTQPAYHRVNTGGIDTNVETYNFFSPGGIPSGGPLGLKESYTFLLH